MASAKDKFLKITKPGMTKPGATPSLPVAGGQARMTPVTKPSPVKTGAAIGGAIGGPLGAITGGAIGFGGSVIGREKAYQTDQFRNKQVADKGGLTAPKAISKAIQAPQVAPGIQYAGGSMDTFGGGYSAPSVGGEARMTPYFGGAPKKPTLPTGVQTPGMAPMATGGLPQPDTRVSEAQKRLDEARANFLKASGPDQSVQQALTELADYRTGTAQAVAGEEGLGRGRTVGLVRGRQGLIQEQRQLGEQNLLSKAEIAQQVAAQNQNIAMQQLGFAKDDLDRADRLIKEQGGEIQSFGNQLLRIAPDGTVTVLAESAGEGSKPITVSAGQTVIDPVTGQVIFQAGERPEALPASIQEYLFATQQGYQGSFQDFNSSGGSGGNLTASAQTDLVNIQSANQIIDQIKALASPGGNLPGVGVFGGRVPQIFTGQSQQEVRAKLGLLRAAVVKANAGTSFTDGERALLEEYLPKPTDTDSMITTKLNNLQQFLASKGQSIQQISGGQQVQGSDPYLGLLQSGQITQEEYREFQGSFRNDLGKSVNGLGRLSEKYESGGNPGAIGYDTTGGYSYGTYQLAHNNAQRFVENSPYATAFKGIKFNSEGWRARWKEIAKKDPQGFASAQKDYIKQTHFDPQLQKLTASGINPSGLNPVVLDAIWSTAVQHGPNNNLVVSALKKAGNDPANQLKAIYAARWSGGQNFRSSTKQVQNSVYNRFFGQNGELNTALSQLYGNNA